MQWISEQIVDRKQEGDCSIRYSRIPVVLPSEGCVPLMLVGLFLPFFARIHVILHYLFRWKRHQGSL